MRAYSHGYTRHQRPEVALRLCEDWDNPQSSFLFWVLSWAENCVCLVFLTGQGGGILYCDILRNTKTSVDKEVMYATIVRKLWAEQG